MNPPLWRQVVPHEVGDVCQQRYWHLIPWQMQPEKQGLLSFPGANRVWAHNLSDLGTVILHWRVQFPLPARTLTPKSSGWCGKAPRFPMGPDKALKRSVGKGLASKDVKAMTGQHACPRPLRWGGDQSSPFRPHWRVSRTSVAVWNETHTPSRAKLFLPASIIPSPSTDLPSHFSWTWGKGKFEFLVSSSKK